MNKNCDLYVSGTPDTNIYLLEPVTDAGKRYIDECVPKGSKFIGNSVAVEFRYIDLVVAGAKEEGCRVRIDSMLIH